MTNREIDALVAEKVMRWHLEKGDALFRPVYEGDAPAVRKVDKWYPPGHESSYMAAPPPYSTDIAAAWEVVGKLGDVIIERDETTSGVRWRVVVDGIETFAATAPMAICLAALKAVGVSL